MSPFLHQQGKCTCLKPVAPTIYGTAANGAATNGYLSYPSTPVPPHHAMHAGPLALTWGGKDFYQLFVYFYQPVVFFFRRGRQRRWHHQLAEDAAPAARLHTRQQLRHRRRAQLPQVSNKLQPTNTHPGSTLSKFLRKVAFLAVFIRQG